MLKKISIFITLISILFAEEQVTYVGDKACTSCHEKEVKEWKGSDHDMSMMVADKHSVKANFNNTTFDYNGILSTFYKKDGRFMVQTDGPDGKLHDYEIAYTFGIYPLQQYMIKFPKGHVQVLDISWDSRPKKEGGQNWFHIHADDNITAGDILHWTGQNLNWNYMCAECHSTNLKKNYDAKTKNYDTTWDLMNVSCEACHGPASKHIGWSNNQELDTKNKGFPITFKQKDGEIEVCAKCHSRRAQLDEDYTPGDKFADHYLATVLEENLYFPDGKIQDEVYVYDSFLQSEMYAQGVTCTDCHNPHTLNRKADGDNVCFGCHQEKQYKSKKHHFHENDSSGSSCISCHMPARTYMGVDSRNDHSFRVPRPDVSVEIEDIPNACNLCHTDKNAKWAMNSMKKWYGKIPVGKQNFGHSLQALRTNEKDAPKELYSILMSGAPDIAKATATTYLGNYPSRQTYTTTIQMLKNSDYMVRLGALKSLEHYPLKRRTQETYKLLDDLTKVVRIEAGRQMATLPLDGFDMKQKLKIKKAFDEYEKVMLFSAERPESQVALASFYTNRNMFSKAINAYKEAISLQPNFIPAYINYSGFLTNQGKNKEAFAILHQGLTMQPKIAALHHVLGLWYVRAKQPQKAIDELKMAVELDKDNARFAYVYAVSIGNKSPVKAISILENAYNLHTGDMQIVSALVYYYQQIENNQKSEIYAKKLKKLQNFLVR